MGDRALVIFWHGHPDNAGSEPAVSPTVYLHWGGEAVPQILAETAKLMADRGPDLNYTAARFVGKCHEGMPNSSLSLGIWNTDWDLADVRKRPEDFTHGDSGIWLVELTRDGWKIETLGGYGFGKGKPKTQRMNYAGEIGR